MAKQSGKSASSDHAGDQDGHGKSCPYYTRTDNGIVLSLHIQPRASREGVVGLHGEALKVALKAPPVDGAANEALIKFLSKRLGIPKSQCELISGQSSRTKRVRVPAECLERVKALAEE